MRSTFAFASGPEIAEESSAATSTGRMRRFGYRFWQMGALGVCWAKLDWGGRTMISGSILALPISGWGTVVWNEGGTKWSWKRGLPGEN